MLSIRSLYQVGHGPSSSHTMGPAKAAKIIKDMYPNLDSYEITLFNSLALTGKGHLTEEAIKESLAPSHVTFLTQIEIGRHPNTLIIKGYQNNQLIVEKEVLVVEEYCLLVKKTMKKRFIPIKHLEKSRNIACVTI